MPLETNSFRLPGVDRLKKLSPRLTWFYQACSFVGFYAIWVFVVRLLMLTFITYFTISPTSRFQDISDAFSSNEVSLMGLSALLFLALISSLNPLTSTTIPEIITRKKIEKNFLPGFVQGSFFSGGLIVAFVLAGVYRYLGYFIQFDEAPLELANVLLRMAALGALVYCEEFIFRYKLKNLFQEHLPDIAAANLIALFYCLIKLIQFDLGLMHLLTLYIASVALFYRTRNEGQFSRGAGFWAATLIIFHPLLSLPIFGNDFPGILLLKYQPVLSSGKLSTLDNSISGIRFLTGGAGGPLSSFAFQLLLILDVARSILRKRKVPFHDTSSQLAVRGT
jgi:hypothetical protein